MKINRQPVADVQSYSRIVGGLKPGDPVVVRMWRRDRVLTAQIDRLSE
jgi:S1-C subfamily serine protease